MSNYIIELSIVHVALSLGYWFFLRKERQYAKMRFYLLASTLLALVIPLLKLPRLLFNNDEPTATVLMETITLDAIAVSPSTDGLYWSDVLIAMYVAVSAFFLFTLMSGIWHLIRLRRNSISESIDGMVIRKVRGIKGSFTFFNWIFVSEEIDTRHHSYDAILKHEKAHASLGHSYDLMFLELFKVVFWWLPTAWFIIREIKKIHEYQADASVLKSCDLDQYSSILISSTLKANGLGPLAAKGPSLWQAGLTSSFHEGLILKRLIAMKQQVKNVSLWKIGALSALCALLVIVFACSEEMDRKVKEMGSRSNTITFDQLPPSMQTDLADVRDQLSFIRIDVPEGDEKMSGIAELQALDPQVIHSVNVNKTERVIYVALKKDGASFNYLAEKSGAQDGIFTVVEQQPEFEGGEEAFYKYILREIRYPQEARLQGVEGRVDVQFVVDKDGSLTDVKAIKGIGAGCDAEAVRVLQNAPRFKPGMQNGRPVLVRMVVPVNFKLSDYEGSRSPAMIAVDKVEAQPLKLKVDAGYTNGEWTGTVYDEQGEGLPGANIVVGGTTNGTRTDLSGSFSLKAPESNDIYISFIGYETVRLEGK